MNWASKNRLGLATISITIAIGLLIGALGELSLKLFILLGIASFIVAFFINELEKSVLGLLIIRSVLDMFSLQQIPAIYGVGVEGLAFLYIAVSSLRGKNLQVDKFWCFFFSWIIFQGAWLLLLYTGSLGFDSSYFLESLREWIRLLLWPSIYLLVMQLKGRVSPQKFISRMLLSLPLPLICALPQLQAGSLRINSSFAHPNAFASFLLLFMGLVWWKFSLSHSQKLIWACLLGVLVFFLISTKALFVLMMLLVSIFVMIVPRISLKKLIGGLLLISLVFCLFASSEYGKERLESIANTPLVNSEISISRGILLSESDHNSFNWRLSQWHTVLEAWKQYPVLGYGLGLSKQAINSKHLPHNDYIRALVENGLVGFLTFLILLFAFLFRAIQMFKSSINQPQRDLCMVLIALIISTLVGMTTENIWSHTVFFLYLSSLMAISDWDWDESKYI